MIKIIYIYIYKLLGCLLLILMAVILNSAVANAHPNAVDWPASCAATTQQTGWAAYDRT
nr:hypothetical protein [Candidatus Saccharibacteria bacterium]